MMKLIYIVIGIVIFNQLIIHVTTKEMRIPIPQIPHNGILVVKKTGGINDVNEIVEIDMKTLTTRYNTQVLLQTDIQKLRFDVYGDSTFKEFPQFTNVTLENPQYYDYVLDIEIPTIQYPYSKKIIWMTYPLKSKPNFLDVLEYILNTYGVTIIY
ncbi:hypothetical protein ACTFIU_007676 [Dictyostelium citrinum]